MNPEPITADATGPAPSNGGLVIPRTRPTPWILLRGPLRDRRHWGSLPARLAAFGPGQVVEAVDLPGYGSRYRETSDHSIAGMVAQVRDGMRRRGITAPVRVLGMSSGALVAVEWARRHPEEVEQLVLINPALQPRAWWARRLDPRLLWPLMRLMCLPATAEHWERTLLRHSSRRYRREDSSARVTLLERWVAWRDAQPVSRVNLWRQFWAAARYRAPTAPPVPGLLLVSARDAMVDPQCSHRLAEAWGWPLVEHPKAGHDVALDDPRWLVRQLRERFGAVAAWEPTWEDEPPFEVDEVEDPRPKRQPHRRRPAQDVTDVDLGEPIGVHAMALPDDPPVTDWGPSLNDSKWIPSDWGVAPGATAGAANSASRPPPVRFSVGHFPSRSGAD